MRRSHAGGKGHTASTGHWHRVGGTVGSVLVVLGWLRFGHVMNSLLVLVVAALVVVVVPLVVTHLLVALVTSLVPVLLGRSLLSHLLRVRSKV